MQVERLFYTRQYLLAFSNQDVRLQIKQGKLTIEGVLNLDLGGLRKLCTEKEPSSDRNSFFSNPPHDTALHDTALADQTVHAIERIM